MQVRGVADSPAMTTMPPRQAGPSPVDRLTGRPLDPAGHFDAITQPGAPDQAETDSRAGSPAGTGVARGEVRTGVRGPEVQAALDGEPPGERSFGARIVRGAPGDPAWARPALLALLGVAAVLYLWDLSASGYANSFYAAAVQARAG